MNTAITPGRWYTREWSCHAPTTVLVEDPTTPVGVAIVAECQSAADAALIAVAPDLLDQLRSLARAVEEYIPSIPAEQAFTIGALGRGTLLCHARNARAAIAKAESQS